MERKMTWKNVSLVFGGGTQEARALKGKRIRVIGPLYGVPTIDLDGRPGAPINIAAGTEGFVGFVPESAFDTIRLCFSKNRIPVPNLDMMMRGGQFSVIQINWPTFRGKFQIDL
jgi:hypothetical protein